MGQMNSETTLELLEVNRYELMRDMSPVDLRYTRVWKKLHKISQQKLFLEVIPFCVCMYVPL